MRVALLAGLLGSMVSVAASGCSHSTPPASDGSESAAVGERRVMLLADTADPSLFLGPEADAPAVGFGSASAKLIIRGPSQQGRTPVRVHGRLSVEAFVPDELFELRAQRRITIAGTPVLVLADNRVRLRGNADDRGQVTVSATVHVGELELGPFEGMVPLEALAANSPSELGEPLSSGIAYNLPPAMPLPLYQAPQGELITLVAPQKNVQTIQVLSVEGTWFRVRLGVGPFLEGYTNVPLRLVGKQLAVASAPSSEEASDSSKVPRRIAETPGALKRVAANTRLTFRGQPLATFRGEGWARVLGSDQHGVVEVLAAADDQVTVRGLAPVDSLSDVDEAALGLTPPSSPASEQQLSPATAQSTTVN